MKASERINDGTVTSLAGVAKLIQVDGVVACNRHRTVYTLPTVNTHLAARFTSTFVNDPFARNEDTAITELRRWRVRHPAAVLGLANVGSIWGRGQKQRKEAAFEQTMKIKKERGEEDMVRVYAVLRP
ncbi:hypothetical protein EVAR_19796_1 [Eumeta japonica]|uniref:Uncharacterized protein n=1 Tax=Eumeta variegata TaxID=151549 RepID=A0A4C1USH0_EUMVA|nr:hypothetical protein EVAR_19796_1 [Eumeta japonica]